MFARQLPHDVVKHVVSYLLPNCIHEDEGTVANLRVVVALLWSYDLMFNFTCVVNERACLTHCRMVPHLQMYYQTHRRALRMGRNFHISFNSKLERAQYLCAYEHLHGPHSSDPDLCQPHTCCFSSISHTSSMLIDILRSRVENREMEDGEIELI